MNQDLFSNNTHLILRRDTRISSEINVCSLLRFIFTLLISVGLSPLFSQQLEPDSLLNMLKTTKADTNMVNILYSLSDYYYDSDPHKSIEYAKKGLSLSEGIGSDHGMSICLSAIGLAYYQLGNFDSSLYFFKRRFKLVNSTEDQMGIATACDNLGVIFIHFGKIDSALAFRQRANEIYIKLNKKNNLAGGYNWIGNIYKEQGDYTLALEYYLKSLKIYEDENDNENAGYPLLNISSIYRYMKQYDKAKSYALEAKLKFSEVKNENAVGVSLYRLSIIYSEEEDHDSSIKHLLEAKMIFEKVNNNYFLTSTNSLLGTCYLAKGDTDKAFRFFTSALVMARSIGDLSLIAALNRNVSTVFRQEGNYKKSLNYLLRADSISVILKDNNAIAENSIDFIEIFSQINKPDSVLKYFHRFHEISDTLYNEKNLKAIAEMQSKYESDKKDQLLLFQKDSLKDKNLIILMSGSGTAAVLMALIIITFLYQSKDRAYKRLVYQNLVSTRERLNEQLSEKPVIEIPVGIPANLKHNNSILDEIHKRQILDCLRESLKTKAYTDANLSILMLAERCGTNRSYLSAVINETYRMNYSTFINKLRIEEAILYLSNSNISVPLKELYQKLGFHSYSVFNEAFKKFVGVTPAYFQKTARMIQQNSVPEIPILTNSIPV